MVLSGDRLARGCERTEAASPLPRTATEPSGGKRMATDEERANDGAETTRPTTQAAHVDDDITHHDQNAEHDHHHHAGQVEGAKSTIDYAASIERVKDCGWYWGPISGAVAERLLLNEPDGSFLVRDSSGEHHIFSLSFRLSGEVRHVRIEHHGGNFSFGFGNKFHSKTIIEFVENAVEHSRSGRYLFFLNQRPLLGPLRVQLLYPVSRLKRMSSLQHLCRLTVFKVLRQRRDLIPALPLPTKLHEYLDTPNYLIEVDPVELCSEPTKLSLPAGDSVTGS